MVGCLVMETWQSCFIAGDLYSPDRAYLLEDVRSVGWNPTVSAINIAITTLM